MNTAIKNQSIINDLIKEVFILVQNKKVLLGVSGGIAAYKACDLTSKLTQQGADVRVIMTESATKFVSPLTFQALSRNEVYTDTFDEKDPHRIAHIDLADWADIIIIAPATANIIGKLANGIADDMLSTTLLATEATTYIAPAMNVHMYAHKAVQENMLKLERWGYHFIEPGAGYLACGYVGKGRLEEPQTIIETIEGHQSHNKFLTGKRVLISAGPTREKIDPVRFFTNRSTGKMGFELAGAAAKFGADVTLVAGPVNLTLTDPRINRIDVTTAEEMYDAMHTHLPENNLIIMSAAVADYRPKHVFEEKMKKQTGNLQLELERTKDILQSLTRHKTNQFVLGFAAETTNPLENGLKKLVNKNLDAIAVNDISADGAGFGVDTNIITYINKNQHQEKLSIASKQKIAEQLLMLVNQDMERAK